MATNHLCCTRGYYLKECSRIAAKQSTNTFDPSITTAKGTAARCGGVELYNVCNKAMQREEGDDDAPKSVVKEGVDQDCAAAPGRRDALCCFAQLGTF